MSEVKFEFYGVRKSFIPCTYDVFSIGENEYNTTSSYPFTVKICKKYTGMGYYFDVEMLIKKSGRNDPSFVLGNKSFSTFVTGEGHDYSSSSYAYVEPSIRFLDDKGELCEYKALLYYSSNLSKFVEAYFESIELIHKLNSQNDFETIWKFKNNRDLTQREELLTKLNLIATETTDPELKQKIKILMSKN